MNVKHEVSATTDLPTIQRDRMQHTANTYFEPAPDNIIFRPGIVERTARLAAEIIHGIKPEGDPYHTIQMEVLANGWATVNAHGAVPTRTDVLPVLPTSISINIEPNEVAGWKSVISGAEAPNILREKVESDLVNGNCDVALSVTGWGESALEESPWRDKFAEGYSAKTNRKQLIQVGVSAYGYAGSSAYPENSTPDIADAVSQFLGGVKALSRNISNEKEEDAFWVQTRLVGGHSMGAWVVANSMNKLIKEQLDRVNNSNVMWNIDNPVVHGPRVNEADVELITSLLGKDGYDPYAVTLLQHSVYGQIVRLAPDVMKNDIFRRLATKTGMVSGIVKYYIDEAGRESASYRDGMSYSVRNYPGYIYNCNAMLGYAGPIIRTVEQLEQIEQLGAANLLEMAIGSNDRVLKPGVQYALASALHVGESNILNSNTHKITLQQAYDRGVCLGNRKAN